MRTAKNAADCVIMGKEGVVQGSDRAIDSEQQREEEEIGERSHA